MVVDQIFWIIAKAMLEFPGTKWVRDISWAREGFTSWVL